MTRLDHGPMYMWVMCSLFILSFGLLLYGPVPNSSLNELSYATQNWLNGAMFLGSSICLYGIIRGEGGLIQKNSDIRVSYNLAVAGAPSIIAALGTYCWALIDAGNFLPSALSSVISVGIIGGTVQNIFNFIKERNRITRNIRFLLEQSDELP